MSALLTHRPPQTADFTLTYERLGASDLAQFRKVALKIFNATFAPMNTKEAMEGYVSKAFAPEQLLSELNDSANHFYMVKHKGMPVGYFKLTSKMDYSDRSIPLKLRNSHAIMLERFYVEHAYHGSGLAHRMMQQCIETAVRLDYDVMWLGVWEKNIKARCFYEKWGFDEVGSHLFQMGTETQTDHWMVREIQ